MYRITTTNGEEYYSDTITPIKVTNNGAYAPAQDEPQGFCAKIAAQVETEDGDTVTAVTDTVFALPGGGLSAPEATYEPIENAAVLLREVTDDLTEAYEILYGGV